MNIYVFGDSFSVEFNLVGSIPNQGGMDYCDWKGYIPKKYYHHLKEHFGAENIFNYSITGNDNENMFEKFTEVYKEIKDDDIIIFSWSNINRFSIDTNIDYHVEDYNSYWGSSISSHDDVDWVGKMTINKSGSLYYNRMICLINFINEILKSNKVIHWTWDCNHKIEQDTRTIKFETGGEVNDFHWNEDTHNKLYEDMVLKLKDDDKISVNLWKRPSFRNKPRLF
jgi:hypothetical protein